MIASSGGDYTIAFVLELEPVFGIPDTPSNFERTRWQVILMFNPYLTSTSLVQ